MATKRFNEPEEFLLQRWSEVKVLNDNVDSLRDKYEGVCQKVVEQVRRRFPDLDAETVRPQRDGGSIGMGKKNWPRMYDSWVSGFYVSEIDFDCLTSHGKESQWASIWLKPPSGFAFDFAAATESIRVAAKRIMSPQQLRVCTWGDEGTCLAYPLPESADLLSLLIQDQSEDFINCLVSHFTRLAEFTPVVDEILRPARKR